MMEWIVGIDLGTTNSLIGVMDSGFPMLLADEDGERLTPSVVYFPETGPPLVGRAAVRMRAVEPGATIYSSKRLMGRRVGEVVDPVSYSLVGVLGSPIRIRVWEKEYLPEEVAGLLVFSFFQ